MGGAILEFSADKYYYAGLKDGENVGEAKGEAKFSRLVSRLLTLGKADEAQCAAEDQQYRYSLYEKYEIS